MTDHRVDRTSDGFRVRSDLKSDQVARELQRFILVGKLAPGDRLPTEEDLCEMFDVSRSVIRDAARRLVAHGLVVVRQGKGTSVAEPNDAVFGLAAFSLLVRADMTIGEVIDARALLESAMVPLAAHTSTEEDWEALEAALRTFSKAVDDGQWKTARDAHLDFHGGLLESLHQPAVQLLLKPMTQVILLSSEPPTEHEPADWEVETHWAILRALKTRDPESIERAMHHHYEVLCSPERYGQYRSRLLRTMFESPQFSDAGAQR